MLGFGSEFSHCTPITLILSYNVYPVPLNLGGMHFLLTLQVFAIKRLP